MHPRGTSNTVPWQCLEVRKETKSRASGEPDVAANLYEQFIWNPRYIDAPVLRDRDAGAGGNLGKTGSGLDERLFYLTDANFNVTALVQGTPDHEDLGHVLERYRYDPYGRVTVLDGEDGIDPDTTSGGEDEEWSADPDNASDVDNEILFCGYRHDPETGLYHVRHRMYHSTLGRWLQRDPLGYVDGMSLYEYVGSSPAVAADAMGLRPMGAQDPGYQPGYENLPWKDIPDGPTTEKEKDRGGGGGGVGGGGGGAGGGVGGGAGGGGGGWYDYWEGLGIPGLGEDSKLGDWQNHVPGRHGMSVREQAILERFNQDLLDGASPGMAWVRGDIAAEHGGEPFPSLAESTVVLTEGVGSGSYLVVGSLVVAAPALAEAGAPHAARAAGWAVAKAAGAYSAAGAKVSAAAAAAAPYADQIARSRPGEFVVGVGEGYTPGPPPDARSIPHGWGAMIGQTLEEITLPGATAVWDTVSNWLD